MKPLRLGQHIIDPLILAPMAGVTDRPFRQICRDQGAGYTVCEMVTSDASLWKSTKSSFRMNHDGEPSPKSVQIVGYDPQMLAEAARLNMERGADIIDINMGCPAKKVCNRLAGSALMQDEALVAQILEAVVNAVSIPVTLKTRTGWNRDNKNGINIAKIAEDCGIQMLAIHGRTRADKYEGQAEYDTIQGQPSYKSIEEIGARVEMAVICTRPQTVPQLIEQCGRSGVRNAIVIAAGFSEAGHIGAALERKVMEIARSYNVRILGPNCLGIIRPDLGLNATFTKITAKPGNLALVSQSGVFVA